jgi:hypothetical protein
MIVRTLDAPDLKTALEWFVKSLDHPSDVVGFTASVDHSPSEQIDGSDLHTSAIVLSKYVEHQKVADELAPLVNPEMGALKQWKKANTSYKKRFHRHVFHVLAKYPVIAIGVCGTEEAILRNEENMLADLGALGAYQRVEIGGKNKIEIGPYFMGEQRTTSETLIVSGSHGPMGVFIACSLLRVHTLLTEAIANIVGSNGELPRIQIFSDRPPNNFDSAYGTMMEVLLGGGNAAHRFLWGGFTESDNEAIDLLADNLAGFFNDFLRNPKNWIYEGAPLPSLPIGTLVIVRLD